MPSPAAKKEVASGASEGCLWKLLVMYLHIGDISVMVVRCGIRATAAFVSCWSIGAAIFHVEPAPLKSGKGLEKVAQKGSSDLRLLADCSQLAAQLCG